jgi:hypothetical protein
MKSQSPFVNEDMDNAYREETPIRVKRDQDQDVPNEKPIKTEKSEIKPS